MHRPRRWLVLLGPLLGACAAVSPPATPSGADDAGFVFRTADGRGEIALGGLFQVVGRVDDDGRDPRADTQLKRMRPELSGVLNGIRFQLEPKFTENDVELEEAWIGPELPHFLGGHAQVRVGRMKAPFNLEEVRSRRHIDFPTFSILNQFAPAEDHGLFLNGMGPGERWEYGLAVYNGTGSSDTNSSKDVAARVMLHPFVDEPGTFLEHLQLGVAGTFGSQDAAVGGDAIDNETGLPILFFEPNVALSGRRERLGLEAAWFHGPWFAQSEIVAMRQRMTAGGPAERVSFRGAYLTLSRCLTGESKSFAGVDPAAPYDFATGSGSGAWIAALRLSYLDLDETLRDGFIAPGTFVDRIRTASAGLNWVPNRNTIVRSAIVGTLYGDAVTLGLDQSDYEVSALVELQLHF